MRKFRFTSTGEEINEGDIFIDTIKIGNGNYNYKSITHKILDDEAIKELIEEGELEEVVDADDNWNLIGKILSQKMGLKVETVSKILKAIEKVSPMTNLMMALHVLSEAYEAQYTEPIKIEDCFFICPIDGKIHKVGKNHGKNLKENYKGYPLFRTYEDAKYAYQIVEEDIKTIFYGEK